MRRTDPAMIGSAPAALPRIVVVITEGDPVLDEASCFNRVGPNPTVARASMVEIIAGL